MTQPVQSQGAPAPLAEPHPFSRLGLATQVRPLAVRVRWVSLSLCVAAVLAVAYATWAKMDVVVSAQGRVIHSGRSKLIQPLEAGVVKTIAVKDGQSVKAGDVLVELDPTHTEADRARLERELWQSEGDVARLSAMLEGRHGLRLAPQTPPDIAAGQQAMLSGRWAEQQARLAALMAEEARKSTEGEAVRVQLEQLRQSQPLVARKMAMREELARTGHIAEAALIDTRLEVLNLEKDITALSNRLTDAQAALRAAQLQTAQVRAEFNAKGQLELLDAQRKRDVAHQELVKANQRREMQRLRSPIDGVVQQLAVNTVGGVVTQAQALMTVVPEHAALEVEAQVLNRDIGHVKPGQRVINKVETFDFTRYGYIEGEVVWVGTDAVQDQKLGPVYPVRIRLRNTHTPNSVNGRPGEVSAGMNVSADIRVDERRMISYFLAPLMRYQQEALRER